MNTYPITQHLTSSPIRKRSSNSLSKSAIALTRGILTAAVALALWVGMPNSAHALTLMTSTTLTPITLGPNPIPPAVGPAYVDNGNGTTTGTWSSPAGADWLGSFTVTGPLPTSGGAVGTATYDFSTLANGYLPIGSYFQFGDLDYGSAQDESYTLTAYDTAGNIITSPWLEETIGEDGIGNGPGNAILPTDMPSYEWQATNFSYYFNGDSVPGNPTVSVAVANNMQIGKLVVSRDSFYNAFGIAAPVPEPSSVALLSCGFCTLFFLVRRRRGTNV